MNDPTWPSGKVFAVTPHNSTNFTKEVRMLYVGVGGNIVVVNLDDSTTTFINVPGGTHIGPFFIKRVNSTSTTATSLVGYE